MAVAKAVNAAVDADVAAAATIGPVTVATAAAGPLFLLLLLVLFLLLFLLQSIQQQWEFLVAIAVDDALMKFAIRDRRMHIWLEKIPSYR